MISFGFLTALILALTNCAPVDRTGTDQKLFGEVEYDVTLKRTPGGKRYFIKNDELPVYEYQFQKIKELGDEIACKIHGGCESGEKRGKISNKVEENAQKKSMFDSADMTGLEQDQMGAAGFGGGLPNSMDEKKGGLGSQKDAAQFGQQPQMDIKMSPQEQAALQAGMGSMSPPGAGPSITGPPAGVGPIDDNDSLLKMQEQRNQDMIQSSINSKMNFMDNANGQTQGLNPGLLGGQNGLTQGMLGGPIPGLSNLASLVPPMSGKMQETGEGKDDMNDVPGGLANSVSENDIMKAEDVQPNEMNSIHSFLKDSNQVEKSPEPAEISNEPSDSNEEPGELGKTNVDFGGAHAAIDNNEGGSPESRSESGGPSPENFNSQNTPLRPGGIEVPTLNNLGLGMSPAELGPPGSPMNAASMMGNSPDSSPGNPMMGMSPNLNFMQENTRQMIEDNSDYKVPQTAFNSLWSSYMTSTQSQLGEKDPSANSRESIERPEKAKGKLHRRSNKKSKSGQRKNH